ARVDELVERFERPFITRCIEVLGEALAAMVDAVDQRIVLEAALVRLASAEADSSPAALLERIERLERTLAAGGVIAEPAPSDSAPARGESPAAAARRAIAPPVASRPAPAPRPADAAPAPSAAPPAPSPAPAAPPRARAAATSTDSADLPTRDELTLAWGDVLLAKIPRAAKARYSAGRFVEVGNEGAVFALPNEPHREKCEEFRPAASPGTPVARGPATRPPPARSATLPTPEPEPEQHQHEPEEIIDVDDLVDAPPDNRTSVDQLTEAFPGAELLQEDHGV